MELQETEYRRRSLDRFLSIEIAEMHPSVQPWEQKSRNTSVSHEKEFEIDDSTTTTFTTLDSPAKPRDQLGTLITEHCEVFGGLNKSGKVYRRCSKAKSGKSSIKPEEIAYLPWFSDWSRDKVDGHIRNIAAL